MALQLFGTQGRILLHFCVSPFSTNREAAASVGCTERSVLVHLHTLRDMGVLTVLKTGRKTIKRVMPTLLRDGIMGLAEDQDRFNRRHR